MKIFTAVEEDADCGSEEGVGYAYNEHNDRVNTIFFIIEVVGDEKCAWGRNSNESRQSEWVQKVCLLDSQKEIGGLYDLVQLDLSTLDHF